MCTCEKPTRNDEMSYWDQDLYAPPLREGDELIYDECGRCSPQVNGKGDVDYHSHHLRLVKNTGMHYLLVKHGGGVERVAVGASYTRIAELLEPMDSDQRYLMMYRLYAIHRGATQEAKTNERDKWRRAAAEKRIRTRKVRGRDRVYVWIESEGGVIC